MSAKDLPHKHIPEELPGERVPQHRRPLPHERGGLGPVLWALLALAGVLTLVAILIVMYKVPSRVRNQPRQAAPHSELWRGKPVAVRGVRVG